MPSGSSELLTNCGAGALSGACQIALFNWLDCLRVRWQVSGTAGRSTGTAGTASEFALAIVRSEGWWIGLQRPGLLTNCATIFTAQGLRFGLYPAVRDVLSPVERHSASVAPAVMMASGLISGTVGYFVAAPLFLLKVRAHAAPQLRLAGGCRAAPAVPSTLAGYWHGSGPLVARGALLTAGQMAGYDSSKRAARSSGVPDGPLLHALAAVVAGFSAATLSAPADVVQTRMQSAAQHQTVLSTIGAIAREGGARAFYRGWGLSVARLVPTFIVGTAIFEQVRRAMGLAYL